MASKKESPPADSHGMFSGMAVLLVGEGVQARRLQIWKQKLMQMGASIEDHFSRKVTHVFAMGSDSVLKELDRERLIRYKTKVLLYQWLESCLREGKAVPEDLYVITLESGGGKIQTLSAEHKSCSDEQNPKKSRISSERENVASPERNTDTEYCSGSSCDSDNKSHFSGAEITSEVARSHHDNVVCNLCSYKQY
ncbi:unnamed protein product [Cuscuta campestris]|uniref:BRCT domain-containing protein n=1 Tax=Cuscuta campestris TaxID=132261 RepID=A0A484MI87_9ASTE|nr:unnamed protein product [Cuscuta campestris]